MDMPLSKEDIKTRAQKMEEVSKRYADELTLFKRGQRELLARFMHELEQRKIEEIKKNL